MKFITILFVLFSLSIFGQTTIVPDNIDTTHFHISPKEKSVVVNGVAFGLSIKPWGLQDTCHVQLQGLNIELGPLGIVGGIYGMLFGIAGIRNEEGKRSGFFSNHGYVDNNFSAGYGTNVRGVSVSIFGLTETFNKGLIFNGLSGYNYESSGVQLSGLINNTYSFKGVTVAGISNITNKAKGIQIGLINKCKTGQVIQIGLFNRIGKRVTPIINFRFRKDKKST